MGKNRNKGGNGQAPTEISGHRRHEQRQEQIASRQTVFKAFTAAAENGEPLPEAVTVQERLIVALKAGHMQKICEATGMTETRINKIAKGTQAAQGDKLVRLKDVLTEIESASELEATSEIAADTREYEMV